MKVVVIGLDAACLHIIMPWVNQGKLPHIERILGGGIYSELRSTIPPWTAPAWSSLITGKNPGKHNIFDFFKQKDNYENELVSFRDNKAMTIWDYLSEAGKRSIVINVPITHPARKINGILIPGFTAPENPTCYPPNILQELEEVFGEYKIYPDVLRVSNKKKLQGYIEVTELRKDTAIYLGKKYEWDFLMVEFQKTDAIFHNFREEKYHLRFYKFIDQCVGEIIEVLGVDANIFLVSDHGMGRYDWAFHINSWLKNEGLLETKGEWREIYTPLIPEGRKLRGYEDISHKFAGLDRFIDFFTRIGISAERISDWVSYLHLSSLGVIVPRSLISKVPKKVVDKVKSIAYCPSSKSLGIKINRTGEEYQSLRNHLTEKLKGLKDLEGNPVFEAVLPREEYYQGPYVANAPDIVFIPREMNYEIVESMGDKLFSPFKGYDHKMDGLFVGVGSDIASSGYLNSTLSIFDVAPTILHIMGLPVPKDIDGRVLREILKEDSEPAKRKVVYYTSDGKEERIKRKIKKLKNIGKI